MTLMTGGCVLCYRWHGRHAYKWPGGHSQIMPFNSWASATFGKRSVILFFVWNGRMQTNQSESWIWPELNWWNHLSANVCPCSSLTGVCKWLHAKCPVCACFGVGDGLMGEVHLETSAISAVLLTLVYLIGDGESWPQALKISPTVLRRRTSWKLYNYETTYQQPVPSFIWLMLLNNCYVKVCSLRKSWVY